jgi:hypothetical protein
MLGYVMGTSEQLFFAPLTGSTNGRSCERSVAGKAFLTEPENFSSPVGGALKLARGYHHTDGYEFVILQL